MKKMLFLVSCFAVILILSKVSFAEEPVVDTEAAGVASSAATAAENSQALPFGFPPYPSVGANPAYGVPYSYPRAPRRPFAGRFAGRFAPPATYQPYPLPPPGAVQAAVPPVANPAPPMYRGRLPQPQGTLVAIPPAPGQPAEPTVLYRPTPIKNFTSLMFAPRPYIGYDPYSGYPPYPGYQPPQPQQ